MPEIVKGNTYLARLAEYLYLDQPQSLEQFSENGQSTIGLKLAASQNAHQVKELSDVLCDLRAINAGEGKAAPLTARTKKGDLLE